MDMRQNPYSQEEAEVGPDTTSFARQRLWRAQEQATDWFQRETACRQALDRINLGLHTSEDVALLRRELNL